MADGTETSHLKEGSKNYAAEQWVAGGRDLLPDSGRISPEA